MKEASAQIFLGDCVDLLVELEDRSVDLILCDLPYGTTACKWDSTIPFETLWAEYSRVAKPNAPIVLTAVQPFTSALVMSNPKWFKHEWIWHKSKCGSAFTAKHRPLAKHESVLVFSNGGGSPTYNPQMKEGKPYKRTRGAHRVNNHGTGLGKAVIETVNTGFRYPETVVPFQQKWRRQDQVHPTQKPVELMEYLVLTYSNSGDTVLDNCMGSGTTGVACMNTGRNFVGMEKESPYYEIAKDRIRAAKKANREKA